MSVLCRNKDSRQFCQFIVVTRTHNVRIYISKRTHVDAQASPMQALILVFVVLIEIDVGLAVALHYIAKLINHSAGHQASEAFCIRLDCLNNRLNFKVILCNGIKNTAGNIFIDIARKSLTACIVADECHLILIHQNILIIDTTNSENLLNSVHCTQFGWGKVKADFHSNDSFRARRHIQKLNK